MADVLVVSPDAPYPPNHGGRVAVWEHAKALTRIGHTVDLLATIREPVADRDRHELQKIFRDVTFVKRRRTITDALQWSSFQVASRSALSRVHIPRKYNFIVIEGPYVARALENPALMGATTLFRVHNDEKLYFRNLSSASNNFLIKMIQYIESFRVEREQIRCLESTNAALFISDAEFSGRLSRYCSRSILLPHMMTPSAPARRSLCSRSVLFVGSLFMPNNQAAVDWYLKFVHDTLSDLPGYMFVIAGRADPAIEASLKKRWSRSRVEIFASPQDLEAVYDSSSVFVNPAQEAAGVKIKVIEAMRNGLPVVSTSKGACGLGLRAGLDVAIADSPAEFSRHVRELLIDIDMRHRIARQGQSAVSQSTADDALQSVYEAL